MREIDPSAQKKRHKQNDKAVKTAWPFIPWSVMSSSTDEQRDSRPPLK